MYPDQMISRNHDTVFETTTERPTVEVSKLVSVDQNVATVMQLQQLYDVMVLNKT